MKNYIKYIAVAVLFGVLCYWGNGGQSEKILLSDFFLLPTYMEVDFYPEHIMMIMHWYIPLLIFHVLYGTFIYRCLCCTGVYYFSRIANRKKWFLRECLKLFVFVIVYLCVMILVGIISISYRRTIIVDQTAITVLIYYLIIFSLFLFSTTLAVNILSIKVSNVFAFSVIEGIMLSCIVSFTVLGKLIENEDGLVENFLWIIKYNPFSSLVFSIHSSIFENLNLIINKKNIVFDLNCSIILWMIVTILVIWWGSKLVEKYEFIVDDKELLG